jgi:superfamily II DNA or RNA helicase
MSTVFISLINFSKAEIYWQNTKLVIIKIWNFSVPSPAKERLSSPSKRPYQSEAIKSLTYFVKTLIQNVEINGSWYFDTASLLEMATGSGKTFTVGKYIEKLIVTRNRHDVLERSFWSLKVILLSNRIDGVSQFRDDLIYGRSGKDEKPPILSEEVRNNIKTSTYHSRRMEKISMIVKW